ncbi:MAG: hypothetical protein AAF298_07395 [Cyanobacteria bacterium P01_A01_bin.40]
MKPSKTIEKIRKYLAEFNRKKEPEALVNSLETRSKKLNQIHDELYSVSYKNMAQLLTPPVSRDQIERWMDGREEISDDYFQQVIELRTLIQVKVLDAIDTILQQNQPRTYLVYHVSDWTLEDYEPEQYQLFGNAEFHLSFIVKLRIALKNLNKNVYATRFNYQHYDSWLNIANRKNSPESLELWAKKRYEEGINYYGETSKEEEERTRKMIAPFVEQIEKERAARGELPES